jgi:hypothetical protein
MGGSHRFAQRRDGNEAAILEALVAAGGTYLKINGKNLPDLAIGYAGHTFIVEIKQPGETLRPDQARAFKKWRGGPIFVVATIEELMQLLRRYGAEPNR